MVDKFAEIEARIAVVSDRAEYGEHLDYVLRRDIDRLRDEISEIKTAIMDVHDMLRSMGMDDMSRRLGDLNLFLT